ncbi:hypothetical protein QYF36_016639 [Acer negundo]|nr:hypothetical protein QYF36_016639 [Acer negundo]
MLATLFLSSPSPSNSPQFHYFSPVSSLNPNPSNPKILKLIKNPEISPSEPNESAIKMPTAPWMRSPPLLQPHRITNNPWKPTTEKEVEKADRALTDKESGVRGNKAMKKIIRNIEKLQENGVCENTQKDLKPFELRKCFEKIGGGGDKEEEVREFGGKMPWSKEERVVLRRMKKEKVERRAETVVDKDLLERLRGEARKMRRWVKVMKAGVTESVVYEIRLAWRRSELALVKFDVPLCQNMERAREILELKTGGLVVWSRKDTLVIYRGSSYQSTSKSSKNMHSWLAGGQEAPLSKLSHLSLENKVGISRMKSNITTTVDENMNRKDVIEDVVPRSIFMEGNFGNNPIDRSLYEREGDRLLDGLGPRFVDWWMWKPLPVDADLLPEVVPGFRPPFRRCPPDGRSKMTDDDLTYLRKLAHPLPTHFVLGRNRKLQGLAAAILKLWERSLIAKIAVKWGVQNTSNEQMANELKCLTGGVLLLRNKFFIIVYRGKDFLPCGVAKLIEEREKELKRCQLQEEGARLKAFETFFVPEEPPESTGTAGTLSEFQDIQTGFGDPEKGNREFELQLEADKENFERELRKQERKLFILNMKIQKSAKELSKLNSAWRPSELDADQEMFTDEERECFRKMGLRMNSNLLLGRRGIFDGVIEGLHQHWKHREVAKVITMQRLFVQVLYTAKWLVAESGGILVSVEKLKEGHAIIIYRGKNYRRPIKLKTDNLLTKRKALLRSLEMQRLGSLKFFAYQRQRVITDLKLKLEDLRIAKKRI